MNNGLVEKNLREYNRAQKYQYCYQKYSQTLYVKEKYLIAAYQSEVS